MPTQIMKGKKASVLQGNRPRKDEKKYYAGMEKTNIAADPVIQYMKLEDLKRSREITRLKMQRAVKNQDFMEAVRLRDELFAMQKAAKKKNEGCFWGWGKWLECSREVGIIFRFIVGQIRCNTLLNLLASFKNRFYLIKQALQQP